MRRIRQKTQQSRCFELAVDPGAALTKVWCRKTGSIVTEPSVVAVSRATGRPVQRPVSAGLFAQQPLTPRCGMLDQHWPLTERSMGRPDLILELLACFTDRARSGRWRRPWTMLVCDASLWPLGEYLRDHPAEVSARRVDLVATLAAAAHSAGLTSDAADPCLVADLGASHVEAGIFRAGQAQSSFRASVGGTDVDRVITNHLREQYGLIVGAMWTEQIKADLASVAPAAPRQSQLHVIGRDCDSGCPRHVTLFHEEVRAVIAPQVRRLIDAVVLPLRAVRDGEGTETRSCERIVLTGGTANLTGLAAAIESEARLPVTSAEASVTCAVRGVPGCTSRSKPGA